MWEEGKTHCQPFQRGMILGISIGGVRDFLPLTLKEVLGGAVGSCVDNPLPPTETLQFSQRLYIYSP